MIKYDLPPLILSVLLLAFFASAEVDRVPPIGTILDPSSGTALTTDRIYIKVDANDLHSGIAEVNLFARYRRDMSVTGFMVENIATLKNPPYEYVWDVQNLPDQDFRFLSIAAAIKDRAGNVVPFVECNSRNLTLDRRQDILPALFNCLQRQSTIRLDGVLSEWDTSQGIYFKNGENEVFAYGQWDRNDLYLALRVNDQTLLSEISLNSPDSSLPIWEEDDIEIFIDPLNGKKMVRSVEEKQILLSPAGGRTDNFVDIPAITHQRPNIDIWNFKWASGIEYGLLIRGTLNDGSDSDTGYIAELRLPWSKLPVSDPHAGLKIGINILNSDLKTPATIPAYATWSGASPLQCQNPSEWGTLLLVESKKNELKIFLGTLIMLSLLSGLGVYQSLRKKKNALKPEILTRNQEVVHHVKQYIESHFSEEVSIKEIARNVNLSASRLMSIFKKETKQSINQYLISKRIEQAQVLLSTTPFSISEIAVKVGYQDSSFFSKQFKNIAGVSPSDFKKSIL